MNELEKRQAMARRLAQATEAMMAALYDLDIFRQEVASAGLTFADADFDLVGLRHLTAARLTTLLEDIAVLKTHMETTFLDDVFNACRP